MNLIAPFGFYGCGNIGDESTLQGFARLLADGPPVAAWVGARATAPCRRAAPGFRYFEADAGRSVRRRWAWLRADAMVVPGGTPIADGLGEWPLAEVAPLVERAEARGLPVVFVGTGTETLARASSRALVATRIAPRVRRWTVRSERDRRRLVEYGVPADRVVTAADLAWLLEPVAPEPGRRSLAHLGVPDGAPLLGVNVNDEAFVRAQRPSLLRDVAAAVDAAVERLGAFALFLCNEVRDEPGFDAAASREVIAAMRHRERALLVPNDYRTPGEMLALVGCCRWTLSTRYHFCLFSALQGVPFVAIERSAKVADLVADLGWPGGCRLEDAAPAALAGALEAAEREHDARREALRAGVERLRARARLNRAALEAIA